MSLLLPLSLVGGTIASVVAPFFLPPTESEKATIQLNKKLSSGNFTLQNTEPVTVPSFRSKLKNQIQSAKTKLNENPEIGFAILILVGVLIMMVIVR